MGQDRIRADFEHMIRQPEPDFELARTALLIAAESDPNVDVDGELRQIEAWAEELKRRLDPGWNNLQKLARLRAFVFEELGFRGNRVDYFSPNNSLLHEVLKRRLGIPISLAIVMLEVGWRVGIPFEGVGFPGHFLVRLTGEPGDLILDPYRRGMMVLEEDCRKILYDTTGGKIQFNARQLASVGKRDMIVRLLNNLKGAYLRNGQDRLALAVVDRLLVIDPADLDETRDRGLLLFRLHQYSKALECLQSYLAAAPNATDRATMERHIAALRQLIVSLN